MKNKVVINQINNVVLNNFIGESKVDAKQKSCILINNQESNVQIINPEMLFLGLYRALEFLKYLKKRKKKLRVLFVNTNPLHKNLTKNIAFFCEKWFINGKWLGGTLTNWTKISKSIKKCAEFEWKWKKLLDKNKIGRFKKIKSSFSGFSKFNKSKELKKPHVLIVLNPNKNQSAIREANLCGIPIIGFVETANLKDMKNVTYPIISNNGNHELMSFCLNWIARVIIKK